MKQVIAQKIEDYAAKHSTEESPLLKDLVKETYRRTDLPQMQVGHLEGGFLRLFTAALNAKRVLEIGTFTGYSALSMAQGMPAGGKLTTCDIDPINTQIARNYWKKSPHGKKISLKIGPALETIKKLKGPYDLVFIDADKPNYVNYWNAVLPKVRKGGFILADNVLWSGRVLNPKDERDRAIVHFNKTILRDKRTEIVMLTVRDGITLARKK
jgi:caffeoyl-CoA O-methyltransferase